MASNNGVDPRFGKGHRDDGRGNQINAGDGRQRRFYSGFAANDRDWFGGRGHIRPDRHLVGFTGISRIISDVCSNKDNGWDSNLRCGAL